MKPKYVKVYQSVYFDRKLHSHFPNKMVAEPAMEVVPGVGVKISDDRDSIFVPYTNVAFVQLDIEKEKKESSKKKTAKA